MESHMRFVPGQKWLSVAEPELGMGEILRTDDRTVSLLFEMTQEERTYAHAQAPITRVRFIQGDQIKNRDKGVMIVTTIKEQAGIFTYYGKHGGENISITETELDPNTTFSKAEDRLLTKQLDDNDWFNLRYHTLQRLAYLAETKSRGLYGARVSLIPHQLYIASEVAKRYAPRVLLADEVGLGKTIEAGLIIHQQLKTSRSQRILVIVPHALTFQWFVEMIRRFNLRFTILDEERCLQIESDNAPVLKTEDKQKDISITNPFDAQQTMLCSINLFINNETRLTQVLETQWDLVIVDEAHHLNWSRESSSVEYEIVEKISRITEGLLLLTATPEQLGEAGHFARLRLLDPHRFYSYERFQKEQVDFQKVAEKAQLMLAAESGSSPLSPSASASRTNQRMIEQLLDQHGTGRVLFRNVRSSISGFPRRIMNAHPLPRPEKYTDSNKFYPELLVKNWVNFDPRVDWLIRLLSENSKKHLVICAHKKIAIELEKKIKDSTSIRSTVFHEDMDLVARDRSANYFSESYKGAQVIICSEIGSEGRNFQFASHLVLFDLPLGPDPLEQRIGRLDRIGQKNDVQIHVPYLADTAMEKLYHWFHEGMDLFSSPNPIAQALFDKNFDNFLNLDQTKFIEKMKNENKYRNEIAMKGRDRLLEFNSHRPEISDGLVRDIAQNQGGAALEAYMEESFRLFGLESEPLNDNIFNVKPTDAMLRNVSVSAETTDHFHYPELPEDGIRITYDRATALAREDVNFFTWEHPIVQQALDIVMSDVTGNSTAITIKAKSIASGTILLETLHLVQCPGSSNLQVDRYLPPSIYRSLITPSLSNIANQCPFNEFTDNAINISPAILNQIIENQANEIKKMLIKSSEESNDHLNTKKLDAEEETERKFDAEIIRLDSLMKVNPNVREEELEYLHKTKISVLDAIKNATMRLDAIRLIVVV
ncbi:MAG: RNA polymerase-associated protein RapA [Gammaproteobacteria bacterium]|uniref:RNA polymerase-associated protein RapA n=1 Tax=OM182 bacterium TaxID=2510334 RepID=A0A520RYM3_9GAMM|nr:RNA polymerase-associated protein RapA [Gammaproteobacteria bacterium]RZO75287.1 MAG: RNA polymerase-associated protein RapA [OM182 bacterium]